MRSVKYQNSLFIKGVLIVVLPCLINSAFIFFLNKHWQKTAQAALATEQNLNVMLTLNDAFDSFLSFGFDVLTNTFRETRASQHGNEIINSDRLVGDKFQKVPPEATKLLDSFTEIRHDIDHLLETVESVQFHDGRSRFNTFAFILKKACVSGSELDTMLQKQLKLSADGALADRKMAADASVLLIVAVVAESLISILLFIFFAVSTVRRLQILANNAASLNQWSEQAPLGGNDELGYLDSVFKDTGARIADIEGDSDERKALVVKSMRAPTATVNAFFEAVQRQKETMPTGQQRAFEQWMQSAKCALSRLQMSLNSIAPGREDKRKSNKVKKSETDSTSVDVSEVVDLCLQELAPLASIKGVRLVNNCESTVISTRRDKLLLIVMKYVVYALRNSPDDAEVQINLAQRDNWVNFSVRDNGEALSPSAQKQIFNDGTNGLYVCKSILESDGGKYGLKPLGVTGNEYWFALPAVPRKAKSIFSVDELVGVSADPRYRNEKLIWKSALFRKAAMIVFIPLIVHLLLFAWMGQQLGALHAMIDKGHKEESLTLTVSSLWLNSFLANSSAAIFLTGRDKKYYTSAVEHVNRVDRCVDELKDCGGLSEDELMLIKETSRFASTQSSLVKKGMFDESEAGINTTLKVMPSMFNRSAQLSDELNHLMGVESHKTHEATQEQVDLQSLMEKLVYGMIFLNLVTAVVLIRLFVVSFSNRINGLVIEAGMVAEGQPLPVSTDWSDEVDQIQGFLALASKSVEVSNVAQKSALTLVALEVSSPLDTLDALFRIIEAIPDSEVCWSRELEGDVRASLESAFDEIDRMLVVM